MKKPHEAIEKLISIGRIHGIELWQVQTGAESSETRCKIKGSAGSIEGVWPRYGQFLEVKPFWDGIAELKREHRQAWEDWKAFEKANKAELAEYERLKAKFEGGE